MKNWNAIGITTRNNSERLSRNICKRSFVAKSRILMISLLLFCHPERQRRVSPFRSRCFAPLSMTSRELRKTSPKHPRADDEHEDAYSNHHCKWKEQFASGLTVHDHTPSFQHPALWSEVGNHIQRSRHGVRRVRREQAAEHP